MVFIFRWDVFSPIKILAVLLIQLKLSSIYANKHILTLTEEKLIVIADASFDTRKCFLGRICLFDDSYVQLVDRSNRFWCTHGDANRFFARFTFSFTIHNSIYNCWLHHLIVSQILMEVSTVAVLVRGCNRKDDSSGEELICNTQWKIRYFAMRCYQLNTQINWNLQAS